MKRELLYRKMRSETDPSTWGVSDFTAIELMRHLEHRGVGKITLEIETEHSKMHGILDVKYYITKDASQ